jgi:A/G-specific adenine glycosylase
MCYMGFIVFLVAKKGFKKKLEKYITLIQFNMFKTAHKNLLKWYKENGRHELPWRLTNDPYKIYVSEIMLQQTQVKTVLERFYFPFLEAFPTLQDLANATEDEVLKKWEGLGYYRRARNMHKAAQAVTPKMPTTIDGLIQMKGVGQSTAHAVASFAYKTPVPILDANVKRILYRVFAVKKASDKELWEMAYKFFDKQNPYEFNQVLMDIGSSICGKNPECELCPIISVCLASDVNPKEFPGKKIKKVVPIRERKMLIYHDNGRYGLLQRDGEFLHGLWGFVQQETLSEEGTLLGEIIQKYSHFHLHAQVYLFEKKEDGLSWFTLAELEDLALSKADHKAIQLINLLD